MVVAFSSFVHCSYELSHTLSAEAFSRLIMIGSLQLGDVFIAQRPPKYGSMLLTDFAETINCRFALKKFFGSSCCSRLLNGGSTMCSVPAHVVAIVILSSERKYATSSICNV